MFFMKKPFKILGIIALAAVTGFSMTACPDDKDDLPKPEFFITVTDIPSTYNGKYGVIILYTPASSEPPSALTAYSPMEKIKGTSIKVPLYNKKDDPWSGSGIYRITILIFENTATETWTYAGVTPETSITEKTTAIAWNSFSQRP